MHAMYVHTHICMRNNPILHSIYSGAGGRGKGLRAGDGDGGGWAAESGGGRP